MEKTIVSVAKASFKGNDGQERTMYKVYICADDGSVGCIYSSKMHTVGEVVELGFAVNKDGKFVAKIIEPQY